MDLSSSGRVGSPGECPVDLLLRTRLHAEMLREAARLIPAGASVLDLGCGIGLLAEQLPDGTRYLGIDRSADAVVLASRRFAGRRGFEFRAGDYSTVDPGHRYDVVTMLDVLHHPGIDVVRLLGRAQAMLQPQGRLILCAPNAGVGRLAAEVGDAGRTWSLEGMVTLLSHFGLSRIHSMNPGLYSGSRYLIAAGRPS